MFKRMRLSAKLISGYLAVAAIATVIGLVGFFSLRSMKKHTHDVGEVALPSVQKLLEMKDEFEKLKTAERSLLNPKLTAQQRKEQLDNIAGVRERYQQAWSVYESLPQTEEESRLWEQFKTKLNEWKQENDVFLSLCNQLDKGDILDPDALQATLEGFRGDHYRVIDLVGDLVHDRTMFEGGEDHTSCAFGKWLASCKTENATINAVMREVTEPHRQFHDAVKQVKELVKADKTQEAVQVYRAMRPLADKRFAELDKIRQEVAGVQDLYARLCEQEMVTCRQKQKETFDLLDQVVQMNSDRGEQAVHAGTAAATLSGVIMLMSLTVGILVAVLLGVFLSLGITRPINRIIASLTEGSEQVSSASGQVSAASQSLAEGATEQAAGLQETSSSLEEMSSMTKQNADNAQQANTLAVEAKKAATMGAESMGRMNAAIQEIQKSSDETAKIIKVIDEIAFQTNLLALNAAVEAARAGEAGKGFAVVAEEVRNLAMRSAEAAKNTASMIEESVKNSKNGVDIANEVSKVLEEIVQSVGKTTDLVSEIAAASQEQAQGIDQVNTAVSQMDKVTQQNAANAEESASASEELSAQAESMKEVVSQLVALVGGAGSQRARSGRAGTERHHFHLNVEHKPHGTEKPKSNSRSLGKSDEVLHKIAGHPDKPQHATAGKTIPLDSREDALHEFNS